MKNGKERLKIGKKVKRRKRWKTRKIFFWSAIGSKKTKIPSWKMLKKWIQRNKSIIWLKCTKIPNRAPKNQNLTNALPSSWLSAPTKIPKSSNSNPLQLKNTPTKP